jgi:hypothetical protein
MLVRIINDKLCYLSIRYFLLKAKIIMTVIISNNLLTNKSIENGTLYETDFAIWIEQTAAALKDRRLEHIDWQNLIEEVESLGKSQKRELESRLTTLLEHLLKRCFVAMPDCYGCWINTITREQQELLRLLRDSPSLINHFSQNFDDCWSDALKRVAREYENIEFPEVCLFPKESDRLLNEEFW